jgi:NitT/TauT family transport system permease protein
MKDAARTAAASSATLLLLLAFWWFVTRPGGFDKVVLPSPADVADALRAGLVTGTLYPHIAATAEAAAAGLATGVALGVLLGAWVALVPLLEMFLLPIVTGMQSIPKVALAPLIVAYLGFGSSSKIFTAALLTFFPMFLGAGCGTSGFRRRRPISLPACRWLSCSA